MVVPFCLQEQKKKKKNKKKQIFKHLDFCQPGCSGCDKKPLNGLQDNRDLKPKWPRDSWNNNRQPQIEGKTHVTVDEVPGLGEESDRWVRDRDADRWFEPWKLSLGGMLEDQLRKEEVTSHRLVSLRPRRLTVPAVEATLDLFEVPDHPAGSLKTCCRWTFIPLAESYSIFIPLLMCTFWGWDSKKHFVPLAAPVGRIINHLYFVTLTFTVMFLTMNGRLERILLPNVL